MTALLPADQDAEANGRRRTVHWLLAFAVIVFATINGVLIVNYYRTDGGNATNGVQVRRVFPVGATTEPESVETEPLYMQTERYMAAHPLFKRPRDDILTDYEAPLTKRATRRSHKLQTPATVEVCREPECLWYLQHIRTKLNERIDPCDDFYSHVCTDKWFAPNDKSTFHMSSLEKLMSSMDMNLRVERHSQLKWLRNSAFLYDACVTGNFSKSLRRALFYRRPRRATPRPHVARPRPHLRLTSHPPPTTSPAPPPQPAVVFKIGLQEMAPSLERDLRDVLPRLHRQYLEGYKVSALANVYMAPMGRKSRLYVPFIDSPDLIIKRFFLRYPNRTEEDYRKLIASTFTDVNDPEAVAIKIVGIEKRLSDVISGSSARLGDRVMTPEHMARRGNATLNWLTELLPSSSGRGSSIHVLDKGYVTRMVDILRDVCAPKDIKNYLDFRTLVHYSPFLNITPLIPLSYGEEVKDVPPKVQGCLRFVETIYKQGMRMLGTEALGGNFAQWRIPFEYQMSSLFEDVKRVLAKYALKWFSPGTASVAVKKIQSMELTYLGARITTPSFYAQNTPEIKDLRDFGRLISDTVRRDFHNKSNLDFMHKTSIFSTEVEYNGDTNALYIPHGIVTLPILLSDRLHPIFVPIVAQKVLHGVMAAIDSRGSESLLAGNKYRTWWSSRDRHLFQNKSHCYKAQLSRAVKRILPIASGHVFLETFMADNAIMEPLYDVYRRRISKRNWDGSMRGDERVKEDRVFFYAYAMGLCERPGLERVQLLYRKTIPARLRVNSALTNFPRFQRAFQCTHGKKMVSGESCSYWK
ncbi:phosphate-regulating neutral endopeptidase PHEX-like [Ornithodoros turicata]|uniref:phosphate-regulating neutral endopeptidase PHEX-like n=1 Tax=Ornithodoros turicata TaxID=34597 RepID=UPI003139C461